MSGLDPLAPFVDDTLVSLRAVQRKRLADVPDWVIDGLRHGIPPTELPLSEVGGRAERRILRVELDDMPRAEEDLKPMSRMVVLLDLADRVATDGYRDPRLDVGPC